MPWTIGIVMKEWPVRVMNKFAPLLLPAVCLVSSCDTATPENYFDRAVLNCNLMNGFAGNGMARNLESPSVKLADPGGSRTVAMTRKEVIDGQILSLEEAYGKVKKLRQTDETKAMLQASLAVYEYVLPVYKDEYQQLARLYDGGAEKKEIEALSQTITAKYAAGFQSRMESLTMIAKPYAERHGIQVKWDVKTSPSL